MIVQTFQQGDKLQTPVTIFNIRKYLRHGEHIHSRARQQHVCRRSGVGLGRSVRALERQAFHPR